ncbi:hypothetical protein MMC29_005117, partial [Sticta canariensis]|nr:hypothetical protein [Sticta canariensis]
MALATSSGTDVQHANYNPSTPSHNDPYRLNWTPAHEARLTHVQTQLAAAQARWSEEQDLWLDEVQGLEELKRAHKKAVKKEAKRLAKKSAAIWKAKANIAPRSAGASEEEEDDDEDGAKAKDGSQE